MLSGKPNNVAQKNVVAIASARKVVFAGVGGAIHIKNTHTSDALSVSLDGGISYFSIAAGVKETFETTTNVIYLRRGAAANITVNLIFEHFGILNGFAEGGGQPANSQSHSQT